jgi:hypothetical protein
MPDHSRRVLVVAALGFLGLEPRAPELRTLHAWLSTWAGIELIAAGTARQSYDLQLVRYDERGWQATFYVSGMAPPVDRQGDFRWTG